MDDPFPEGMLEDIELFFQGEDSRPPGEDLYDDVFLTNHFFPLQRQRELSLMISEARQYSPKVVYEIGADKGGGLYHWCKSLLTVSRVIACEIRGTPYRYLFEKAFPHIDFLWIEGSSYAEGSLAQISEWLKGDSIDVTFIDGDKANFELDFDRIFPMMSHPSVVFMHDVTDPSPGAAFNRVVEKTQFQNRQIVNQIDTSLSLEREKLKVPSTSPHENWLRHWKGQSCGVGVIHLP